MDAEMLRWLRRAAEATDAAIVVHAPDTTILWANEEAARILGIPRESLIGRRPQDPSFRLLDEDGTELPHSRFPVIEALQTGASVSKRIVGQLHPGSSKIMWGRVSAAVLRREGELEAVVMTFVDVTALQEARRALQSSERRLGLAMEGLDAGQWEVDLEGDRVWYSPQFAALLGLEPGDLTPDVEAWRSRVHPDDLDRATAVANAHLEGRAPYDVRYRMRHADGGWRHLRSFGSAFREGGGPPTRMAGLLVDVTAEHDAEVVQARLQRQAETAARLESLAVLAGGVAHDFNNLLVGMLGAADAAEAVLDRPEEVRELLGVVRESATRAADLTRQLMAYAGRAPSVVAVLDLATEMEELIRLVRGTAGRNARIELDKAGGGASVEADPTQLRQVLLNLLVNACEALPDGRGPVRIRTFLREVGADEAPGLGPDCGPGTYAAIRVSDEGVGMDAATQARIFEPFFTTKPDGHGLGLAAIHGLVRTHRGYVTVQSTPGQGTTFELGLPSTDRSAAIGSSNEQPPVRRPRRVLVVDDEDMVRKVTCRMLEAAGLQVDSLPDGTELLERVERFRPDLLLLDVTLPYKSGLELHAEVRQGHPELPVLLMSGHVDAHERIELADSGPTGFLPKPFRRKELMRRVGELTGDEP